MADIDKIREGLFLGGLTATEDIKQLTENGITHILTLNTDPVKFKKEHGIKLKYIQCLDMAEQDLLSYFDECFKFIDEALSRPGQGILVHCVAGISRSATIVIAYLMSKEKLSLDAATSSVKQCRRVRPNDGFQEQLELFERMGSVIHEDNKLYRRYRLQVMAEKVQAGDRDALSRLSQVPKTAGELTDNYYRCAKCRKVLFKKSSILPHAVGRGEEAFGWQSKVPWGGLASSVVRDLDIEVACDRSLFIEPVQWMSKVISEIEGKLTCPHCNVKLGSFVWYGEKCPCGTWVAPSFHIQTNKVDLVKPRPQVAISRPGVASQGTGPKVKLQQMDAT